MRRGLLVLALLAFGLGVHVPVGADEPVTKRCVGDPPRQTEDPMSPPCEAFFVGDNGGDTWPGVTRDEITVLVYFDSGIYGGERVPAAGTYLDLVAPAKPACPATYYLPYDANTCDSVLIRTTRALSLYFNDRFQTYDRRAHFYAYISGAVTATDRRADAIDNIARLHPFAVLDQAVFNGHNRDYDNVLAARGVSVFASPAALMGASAVANAPMLWSFWPDIEHRAALYSSYVCSTLVGRPASHAGTGVNGVLRSFGLYSTSDPGRPDLRLFADLVREQLLGCGVGTIVEASFSQAGFIVDGSDIGVDQLQAVATFKALGVSTVLWLGGVEGRFSHTAAALQYFPEIVLAGDLELETNATGRLQNQAVWQHAWAIGSQLRIDTLQDTPSSRAIADVQPGADENMQRFGLEMYRDQFMLFVAVQSAGSLLTPAAVELGLRATAPIVSGSPYVASCSYDPGDFSCVKDAAELWWDPAGLVQGGTQPGCMRMVSGGRRYRAGTWPGIDAAFQNPADPCTAYGGSWSIRIA